MLSQWLTWWKISSSKKQRMSLQLGDRRKNKKIVESSLRILQDPYPIRALKVMLLILKSWCHRKIHKSQFAIHKYERTIYKANWKDEWLDLRKCKSIELAAGNKNLITTLKKKMAIQTGNFFMKQLHEFRSNKNSPQTTKLL